MPPKKPECEKATKPFQVLLTPDDYYRLECLAKENGGSKGALIQALIRNWPTKAERIGLIQT